MRNLFVCLLSIALFSCEKEEDSLFNNYTRGFFLECEDGIILPILENDSTIHFAVNKNVDLKSMKLVANFQADTIVALNGVSFFKSIVSDFSDFVSPSIITIEEPINGQCNKKIIIYDLPVIIIDTPDKSPILSKDERVKGCAVRLIKDNEVMDLGTAGIKVRGNSTAMLPKKPYNVKLDEKHSVLGMENSKHYTLLANAYYDRTQLHNATAFEIARKTDFPYVQKGEFVEVILNGEHKGLYYLCEKPRVSKGRINITEMSESDTIGISLTGGYFLESDIFSGDIVSDYFNTTGANGAWTLYWNIESPEDILSSQYDYIIGRLNHMESLIYNLDSLKNGSYRNYFDIESAINWYLVQELTLNEEASRTKNCFLYKDRGNDKFYIGPPWDFDAWTFGVRGTEKFYCDKNTLYFPMLFKDEYFINRLKEKWNEYKPKWESEIPTFIEETYIKIYNSALRNDVMWPDWIPYFDSKGKTYEGIIEDMLNAFKTQLSWMDSQM